MKNKHCQWCDHAFQTEITYQIYCSVECREAATKEKIAERYTKTKRKKRVKQDRKCTSCAKPLSIYNDNEICEVCLIDPKEVKKALKDIKGLSNGKE
tara:strand:+ start:23228 stop:23518 length:291 start_codon:yes stop_codon:yes gene_type:complete